MKRGQEENENNVCVSRETGRMSFEVVGVFHVKHGAKEGSSVERKEYNEMEFVSRETGVFVNIRFICVSRETRLLI